MFTVYTLKIGTPELLTIFVLKFEQVHLYYLLVCLKTARWVANNVDLDQMLQNVVYDLGLHCLPRPVCPITYYGNT